MSALCRNVMRYYWLENPLFVRSFVCGLIRLRCRLSFETNVTADATLQNPASNPGAQRHTREETKDSVFEVVVIMDHVRQRRTRRRLHHRTTTASRTLRLQYLCE